MKKSVILLIAVCISNVFSFCNAQSIINTSSISHDLDSTISIVIDAGGDFSRGNADIDNITLNSGIGKSLGKDASLWLLGGYNELRGNGSLIQRASFTHLRLNYEVKDKVTLSAFTQAQTNSVLDLGSRFLLGSNVSFDLNVEKNTTVMIGLFQEVENYSLGESKSLLRMNIVGFTEYKINDLELVGFVYYQPSIKDFKDSRYIGEVSLRFPLITGVQVGINGVGRYDSQPHSSLGKWDFGIKTSLRYEFHKN